MVFQFVDFPRDSASLNDLLSFRIETGDGILKQHMEQHASDNAMYTSTRIQNELISL